MSTTLLVDADGVAFLAATAAQKTIHWEDNLFTTHADLEEAKAIFAFQIDSFLAAFNDDAKVILCFSCPSRHYFRHDLLPTYKANRKGAAPLALKALKEWASSEYVTKTKPNLEADDVLGILATHKTLVKGEKVIVSDDKDLDQIPGAHLKVRSYQDGPYHVTPEMAERQLWMQVLTGDSTDNYSGCQGIGPVQAERILDGGDYYAATLKEYVKAGQDDLEVQFNVARILTASTYNFRKKEPKLWKMPPA